MENTDFLEKLKFGIGDGNLQYYLYLCCSKRAANRAANPKKWTWVSIKFWRWTKMSKTQPVKTILPRSFGLELLKI